MKSLGVHAPRTMGTIMTKRPSIGWFLAGGLLLGDGCGASRTTPPVADAAPSDTVRLETGSPKLGYLAFDTVAVQTERAIAVLPAQLVMSEDHTVRVASPVVGRISRLPVEPGASVTAGQALADILSPDLAQASADLARAEAQAGLARSAHRRATDLYEHHVIATKDLEQAANDLAQAEAEANRARLRARHLGDGGANGEFVLRAPIAGRVMERLTNLGAEVRPDNGTTLFTISATEELWLVASLAQRNIGSVHVGDRLVFTTDAAPGARFPARVNYVSDALDPVTRTAQVRGSLPNPGRRLKPQVFGEVRLVAPVAHGLVVPTAALVTHGSETIVFVRVSPTAFVRRVVTVADDDGDTATVVTGLRAGDVVVTRGSLLLSAEAQAGS